MEFPLSASDYQNILNLYKKAKDKRSANYLNIILLAHKRYSQTEIADILNLDENTISTWVNKFKTCENIEAYLQLNYQAYGGKLAYGELAKLVNFVKNKPFTDTKPIISHLKECFKVNYSASGMSKLLQRLGFSYKQPVSLPAKLDGQKQEAFIEKYELIQQNLTDKCALFFMDAVHPQHNTHRLKAWLPKGEPSYVLSNNGRNRLNINGLYNPHQQEVLVTYHQTINAQATIETLNELQRKYPNHQNLYVFADNAKYYVSKVLKAYLAENPVIKLIHLPPYSPNLNLIERLWKYTRKEVINHCYYEKFETFTQAIKDFFQNIAQHKEKLAQFIGLKFRLFDLGKNPKTNFA